MYIKDKLTVYLDKLASLKSVPGGGSAAALAGAIGLALSSMVANFTISNIKYKSNHKKMKSLLNKNELLRRKAQIIVDKDAKAFLALQKATLIGKSTKKRDIVLQKKLKNAADIPFELCQLCKEAVENAASMSKMANIKLFTDIGCAIYLLEAAFNSAGLNVLINIKYIKDKRYVRSKKNQLKKISLFINKMKKKTIRLIEGNL